MAEVETSSSNCAFCLAPIGPEDAPESCPACAAKYHHDCWQENGGCAVYGCACTPVVENRRAIEVPVGYWGQENKPCPACRREILAAATRCRHCGVTFASARPQDAAEFQGRAALAERLPQARQRVVMLFVFSIVPFLAPIGVVWGLLWRQAHRDELAALPPLYAALHKIGLVAAATLTIVMAAMTILFVTVRGG
jgi:hypothetical protein